MRLIVDASVAVKWLVAETGSVQATRLKDHDLAAPSLICAEVANTLATLHRRGTMSDNDALEAFALFQTAPLRIVEPDDALEAAALMLAVRLAHPVYDCLYVALAQRLGTRLVTADRRFLDVLARDPALMDAAIALDQV